MIFVLMLATIVGVTTLLSYVCQEGTKEEKVTNAWAGLIITGVIATIIMVLIWSVSYNNYIGMQKKLATIEQYQQAVELYAKNGVAEFEGKLGNEMTDLKYQNYQTEIGQMIKDLRDNIVEYNETLAGKTALNNSLMWNWCIVMPDNAKLLIMSDYLK